MYFFESLGLRPNGSEKIARFYEKHTKISRDEVSQIGTERKEFSLFYAQLSPQTAIKQKNPAVRTGF